LPIRQYARVCEGRYDVELEPEGRSRLDALPRPKYRTPELAARAGTTQTVISRLEGGAVMPTLPLPDLEGEPDLKIMGASAS